MKQKNIKLFNFFLPSEGKEEGSLPFHSLFQKPVAWQPEYSWGIKGWPRRLLSPVSLSFAGGSCTKDTLRSTNWHIFFTESPSVARPGGHNSEHYERDTRDLEKKCYFWKVHATASKANSPLERIVTLKAQGCAGALMGARRGQWAATAKLRSLL